MSDTMTTSAEQSPHCQVDLPDSNPWPSRDNLERCRLSVASSNRLYLVPVGGRRIILKVFTESPRHMLDWLVRFVPQSNLSTVRQRLPEDRCLHERRVIEHWQRCGQAVPTALSDELPYDLASSRSLALEWIESPSLQALLRDITLDDRQRMNFVEKVFAEMADRHRLALETDDARLAHLDANTGNVLVGDERVYRIDFEMACDRGQVVDLLAYEVVKLCRWIARDWNPVRISDIASRLVGHYSMIPQVLYRAISITTNRPFSWWHRLRDQRKKQKFPHEVTKYDVVDAIARSLRDSVDLRRPSLIHKVSARSVPS